jgi:hypothetical protein
LNHVSGSAINPQGPLLAEFCIKPFGGLENIKVYVMVTESSASAGPPKDPFVLASSGGSAVE